MQALILAGGEGTRLRPLTSTVPKPVVPLVDRPFIAFMLDWLRGHRVDDVIMSCGHMAGGVRAVLGDGSAFGVRLRFLTNTEHAEWFRVRMQRPFHEIVFHMATKFLAEEISSLFPECLAARRAGKFMMICSQANQSAGASNPCFHLMKAFCE